MRQQPAWDPVLIPSWVYTQLKRFNLPLRTVLNLGELKNYVSQEDQALILEMNDSPTPFFGSANIGQGLLKHWSNNSSVSLTALKELTPLYQEGVAKRLLSVNPREPGASSRGEKAFEIFAVDTHQTNQHVFLVVIYPDHFGANDAPEVQQLLRRTFLKQSYENAGITAMVGHPVFLPYLCAL